MRKGVASSTTFNTYDVLTPWGAAQNWNGWGTAGGAIDPINVLNAYPHVFPIGLTLKDLLLKNNVGATLTKYKLGIYSNLGGGVPYPSARIFDNPEINPLPTGITTISPNLGIGAGTLLWIVHTCDNTAANINLSSLSVQMVMGTLILGTIPAMTADPSFAWQVARTYDGTLPATFPTAAPTPISTGTPPAFLMRFG